MKHAGLKLVLVLILLAALATGGWFFLKPAPSATARLPNGMIVRYLGAARGETNFKTEKSWHKLVRRSLPARWQYWIPQPMDTTAGGSSNNVTFYWDVIDPTGAGIGSAPWTDYVAEDDDGFRYERGGGYSSFGGSPGRSVFALQLRSFPRRQPGFLFRFLDVTGTSICSVRLPNPLSASFPKWTPEPLPVTLTNEPVVLTLAGVAEGSSGQHRFLRPEWRLTSTDPLWSNARPSYFQCEDATGNEGSFLSLKEPAWKIRTWVHRRQPQEFTDQERLILTNLTVPGPGALLSLDVTAQRAGVELHIRCLSGAGSLYITNGTNFAMVASPTAGSGWSSSSDGKATVMQWSSQTPFFLVEAAGTKPRDDVRFRVLDEQGREVKQDAVGSFGSGGSEARHYQPGFTPPDGVKAVSLEIIISRPREFEFMINPANIQRAAATSK